MKTKKTALIVYRIMFFLIGTTSIFPALALAYDLKEYYPLNQGDTWRYSVIEGQKSQEEVVKIEGREIVGSVETQKIVYSNNGYGCLAFDSEGLKQYKYFDEYGYEIFVQSEMVFPNEIKIGEAKEYPMSKIGYSLAGEKIDEKKESIKISLESTGDIKVPAGKFINCLKFSIISEEKSAAGDYNKDDCVVWLAQGVGEVKAFCIETQYNAETKKKDTFTEIRELVSAIINGKNIGNQELPTK